MEERDADSGIYLLIGFGNTYPLNGDLATG